MKEAKLAFWEEKNLQKIIFKGDLLSSVNGLKLFLTWSDWRLLIHGWA